MSSNQLLEEMGDNRNWKLASLMTVLDRLAEKGAVHCDRITRTFIPHWCPRRSIS